MRYMTLSVVFAGLLAGCGGGSGDSTPVVQPQTISNGTGLYSFLARPTTLDCSFNGIPATSDPAASIFVDAVQVFDRSTGVSVIINGNVYTGNRESDGSFTVQHQELTDSLRILTAVITADFTAIGWEGVWGVQVTDGTTDCRQITTFGGERL